MVTKRLDWENGATLYKHTKKKHKVLREYLRKYLITRCQLPQQEKFKLIIVDGFSGAGLYDCGNYGSPLIFTEVLKNTLEEINIRRTAENLRKIQIECLLILNDFDIPVIKKLQQNIAPLLGDIKENNPDLIIQVEFFCEKFNEVYPHIKKLVKRMKCRNILFNLDQYGYSEIDTKIINDITRSWRSYSQMWCMRG